MTNITIKDALNAIKKAREKNKVFVNESSDQIINYEGLIERITKTNNYCIVGDCVRNSKGHPVVELYPNHGSIRITKEDLHLMSIIEDHIKRNSQQPKSPVQSLQNEKIDYRTIENTIKQIEKKIFIHWNGNVNEGAVLEDIYEKKAYQLIEKHYEHYPKAKDIFRFK